MPGFYLILCFLALFGFLPLAIILYRKSRTKRILTTGLSAKARVYRVVPLSRSAAEMVAYTYYGNDSKQYYGSFSCKAGTYRQDEVIEIFFDPNNPKRSTVTGAWGSPFIIAFGIALGLVVLFATFKIYEMWQRGEV